MSTNTKLLAKIDAVLTDDLKDSYLEYSIDVETINSTSVNLFAEVEFIEAANLDQVIATSTFAWAMFPYECPLLPYQELIKAEGEVSRSYSAKLLHQHFHRRVREKLDLTPLPESEKAAWLSRERRPPLPVRPRIESEFGSEERADYHCSEADLQQIADLVKEHFPEEAAYYQLAMLQSENMGFGGIRGVGHLNSVNYRIRNSHEHLFGELSGAFWQALNVKMILGWGS